MATIQDTKISVGVLTTLFHDWQMQLEDCFMKRDAFLEHVLRCELPHLRADLAGKRNSDQARAYIGHALRRMGVAKSMSFKTRSFKISKATADELREIEQEHNLVRDALINRLVVLMRSRPGLLRALDLSETVHWNSHSGSVLHVGPLPNLLEVLADPFYDLRQECQRVHGCGLHALDMPHEMIGFSLYLEDMRVPGTAENDVLNEALARDVDMTLLDDAERFTENLTPIRPGAGKEQ